MAAPVMPEALSNPRTCVDSQGRIYVVGGQNFANDAINSAYRYDPLTQTWDTLADMNGIRCEHGLVCDSNDHVFAIGGTDTLGSDINTCEEYDPDLDTWTNIDPLPSMRRLAGVVIDDNDDIYCVGGYDESQPGGTLPYRNTTLRYRAGSWTTLAPFTNHRFDHACVIGNGSIGIAGGAWVSGGVTTNTVEWYNIAGDFWTAPSADMIQPRRSMHVVIDKVNGLGYMVGGSTATVNSDITEALDTATLSTLHLSAMHKPRATTSVAIDNQGRVLIAGGTDAGTTPFPYLDSAERYDPDDDSWELLDALVYSQFGHGSAYSDNTFFIFGGSMLDLSDFNPVESPTTFMQSIFLPSAAPGGGGGGGGSGSSSSGTGRPSAGFIPITNIPSFSGYPGDGVYPSDSLYPMDV
jgi:hypothetical protein